MYPCPEKGCLTLAELADQIVGGSLRELPSATGVVTDLGISDGLGKEAVGERLHVNFQLCLLQETCLHEKKKGDCWLLFSLGRMPAPILNSL